MHTLMNKSIRGYIIKLIYEASYPKPLGSNIIESCLIRVGMGISLATMAGHLNYLQDRDYIKTNEVSLGEGFAPVILVSLTSKGVDLLEGTIIDDGVNFKGADNW
jgi:repressor of nif and glnA expression